MDRNLSMTLHKISIKTVFLATLLYRNGDKSEICNMLSWSRESFYNLHICRQILSCSLSFMSNRFFQSITMRIRSGTDSGKYSENCRPLFPYTVQMEASSFWIFYLGDVKNILYDRAQLPQQSYLSLRLSDTVDSNSKMYKEMMEGRKDIIARNKDIQAEVTRSSQLQFFPFPVKLKSRKEIQDIISFECANLGSNE